MVNLRAVYRAAEEHVTIVMIGMFVAVGVLLIVQSFLSPFVVLAVLASIAFALITIFRPFWTLLFLALYLPFEPFLLKFIPDDIYLFARFFSEGLVYALFAVTFVRRVFGPKPFPQTPANLPLVLFCVVLVASAAINFIPPTIAVVGIRQILRFVLLFFIVAFLRPEKHSIQRLTVALLSVVIFQSLLGVAQVFIGAPLDEVLLPSESRTFGSYEVTEGTVQFWDPGSRIFGTLGRYDRLGTFLAFFLIIAASLLYESRLREGRQELWVALLLGLPALLLTYSRSSWFGFLLGFLFVAVWVRRDKRVLAAFLSFVLLATVYLGVTSLNVRFITETPGQTLVERFYETFSYARWSGEYYGYGRLFWIIQTLVSVVPGAPIFGWGPGTYGGGAAILFHNTKVYDILGLPFGVYGTEGHIDNNWFSLWGETGTLGLAFFLWMYIVLFRSCLRVARKTSDAFTRSLAYGVAGTMIAVALNAFLATFFEVRSLVVYLWMYAGFVWVLAEREKIV